MLTMLGAVSLLTSYYVQHEYTNNTFQLVLNCTIKYTTIVFCCYSLLEYVFRIVLSLPWDFLCCHYDAVWFPSCIGTVAFKTDLPQGFTMQNANAEAIFRAPE